MQFRWQITFAALCLLGWWCWTEASPPAIDGQRLFVRHCASCHGPTGKGDGPLTKATGWHPTDLTKGVFKFRSTPSGSLPTDEDLRRTLLKGVGGTPMIGMEGLLSDEEVQALVTFIKTLSPAFQERTPSPPLSLVPLPPSQDLLKLGQRLYRELACATCHGEQGKGDGPMAKTLKDTTGRPLPVRSFENAQHFKGGSTPTDIYRAIMAGLDGTPMPAFSELLSEEEGWALAYYVHSLIRNQSLPLWGTNLAVTTVPQLPTQDNDWEKLPSTLLALQPTWQTNSGPQTIRVRTAYDGRFLAVRLQWQDRSPEGNKGKSLREDAAAVQLPMRWEASLPSVFQGDSAFPVQLLVWSPQKQLRVLRAAGVLSTSPMPSSSYRATGRWQSGQWTVTFTLLLPSGQTRIPVTFGVWDGQSGDEGLRRRFSGWHFLTLTVAQ